ncbi:MAG: TlpA family protein disulfide reductase [Candidatus Symbiothrix sp.]|jgi:thiol-disulfide isomerase/thioredoxin|nr:TlpA family protein disulfide reductase [Candidatus Symbiothrix sp.]
MCIKHSCILYILLILSPVCFAQQPQYAEIKGSLEINGNEITLSAVENGATKNIASTKIGQERTYGFLFAPPYDGFYTLNVGRLSCLLYLRAGDKANLDILAGGIASLVGDNTKENKELYKWLADSRSVYNKVYTIGEDAMSTFRDFYPEFEKLVGKTDSIKKTLNSGNAAFDEILRNKIDYDMDCWFLTFFFTPRIAQPEEKDRISYYNSVVSEKKFVSDDILKYPEGMKILYNYLTFNRIENKIPYTTLSFTSDIEYIPNPVLKGEFLLFNKNRIKTYDQYLEFMQTYGNHFVTPDQKMRAEDFGASLYEAKAGAVSADFSYPDQTGKIHSLSEYRGKVVVVDVWATWCGPCRQQFPYLKALEKKMQGTDVVFMGVSIDADKDKEKWIKMIESEGLPGVHLFAGNGESKIKKDYKINAIPRYLVFDKKGNVVTEDAPRPQDTELEKILKFELAK